MVDSAAARRAWLPRPARHCDPLYILVYRQSSLLYASNNRPKWPRISCCNAVTCRRAPDGPSCRPHRASLPCCCSPCLRWAHPRVRATTPRRNTCARPSLLRWLPSTAAPFAPAGGDSEALQRYPLYPYLQAARLNRQLALIRPVAAQPGGDARLAARRRDRCVSLATGRSTGDADPAVGVAGPPRRAPGLVDVRRTIPRGPRHAIRRCAATGSPRASRWARSTDWRQS